MIIVLIIINDSSNHKSCVLVVESVLNFKKLCFRGWLCKSMDPNFVKKLSLVGLILYKHRGSFDFLCKACFQHKPRIITKFKGVCGKCNNTNGSHKNSADNQQLVSCTTCSFYGGAQLCSCSYGAAYDIGNRLID